MARFYGTVQGGRGKASRLGHATTGLHVTAQSFSGNIHVELRDHQGEDHVLVWVTPHGGSGGRAHTLYWGPIAALLSPGARMTFFTQAVADALAAA